MKFDNVSPIVAEARRIELPLGATVVAFMVTHCDPRSPEYLRVKSKVSKPYRKLIEVADALPPAKDREIAIDTFVQCCIVGWEGVKSDGVDVPFTPDNCRDLLVQSPSLFYSLINEAQDDENFLPTKADAGN